MSQPYPPPGGYQQQPYGPNDGQQQAPQYGAPQQQWGAPPPQKQKRSLGRRLLIWGGAFLGVIVVIGIISAAVGGGTANTGATGKTEPAQTASSGGGSQATSKASSKPKTTDDKTVGDQDHPLTIHSGKAFDVRGFSYLAGWKLKKDILGDAEVTGLRVKNDRKKTDSALVDIKVWKGNEIKAVVSCNTEPIQPGTVTRVECGSADKLPAKYTKVTINDEF